MKKLLIIGLLLCVSVFGFSQNAWKVGDVQEFSFTFLFARKPGNLQFPG